MRLYRYVGGLLSAAVLAVLFTGSLSAVPSLSEGYTTEDEVAVGGLVSLIEDSADTVVASNRDNVDNLLGIVVSGATSPLILGTGTSGEVQVATSGSTSVLVSNINGEINQGDQITASPISGIGMRATSNSKVIGVAQASCNCSCDDKSICNHYVFTTPISYKLSIIFGSRLCCDVCHNDATIYQSTETRSV